MVFNFVLFLFVVVFSPNICYFLFLLFIHKKRKKNNIWFLIFSRSSAIFSSKKDDRTGTCHFTWNPEGYTYLYGRKTHEVYVEILLLLWMVLILKLDCEYVFSTFFGFWFPQTFNEKLNLGRVWSLLWCPYSFLIWFLCSCFASSYSQCSFAVLAWIQESKLLKKDWNLSLVGSNLSVPFLKELYTRTRINTVDAHTFNTFWRYPSHSFYWLYSMLGWSENWVRNEILISSNFPVMLFWFSQMRNSPWLRYNAANSGTS